MGSGGSNTTGATDHSTGSGLTDSGRGHLTENTPTSRTGADYTDSSTTGLGHSGGKTSGLTGARDGHTAASGTTAGRDTYDQTGTGVGVGSGLTSGSHGKFSTSSPICPLPSSHTKFVILGTTSTSGVGSSTTSGLGSSTIGSGSGVSGSNVDHQMFHPMGKDGSGYSAEHLAEHTGHMSHSHGAGHDHTSSRGTGAGVLPTGSTSGSGIGSSTGSGLGGSSTGSGIGLSTGTGLASGTHSDHHGSTMDSGMTGSRPHYEAGDMPGRMKGATNQDAYGSATGLGSSRDGYAGRAGDVADENDTLRR